MSSYLVAFANGNFEYIESSYVSPLSGKTRPLRIYGMLRAPKWKRLLILIFLATEDHIHQAEFALEIKRKVLPLYEQMFDVEFPLPKLDTLIVSTTSRSKFILINVLLLRPVTSMLEPWKTGFVH